METDKQKLIDLLKGWKVPFYEEENSIFVGDYYEMPNNAGNEETVDGYNGFFIAYEFDEYGKFIKMGAWE
jgi:hypothetical protein